MNKILLIIASILLIFFPFLVSAIGQMTEPIVIKDALRGRDYQEKLTLLNSSKSEVFFDLEATGQIAAWAVFYEITDTDMKNAVTKIKIPPEQYQDAIVKFSIPDSVPNGNYQGSINVNYTPPEAMSGATSTTLKQSIGRQVSISVSDNETINFDASVIPEKYDLALDETLKIRIIYDNQSNIDISPQIDLKIKNSEQTFYSAIFPFPDSEKAVKPGSQQEIAALTIPTDNLDAGSYIAELEFQSGEAEAVTKNFSFSINAQEALPLVASTNFFESWGAWIILIFLVIIIGYSINKYLIVPMGNKSKQTQRVKSSR